VSKQANYRLHTFQVLPLLRTLDKSHSSIPDAWRVHRLMHSERHSLLSNDLQSTTRRTLPWTDDEAKRLDERLDGHITPNTAMEGKHEYDNKQSYDHNDEQQQQQHGVDKRRSQWVSSSHHQPVRADHPIARDQHHDIDTPPQYEHRQHDDDTYDGADNSPQSSTRISSRGRDTSSNNVNRGSNIRTRSRSVGADRRHRQTNQVNDNDNDNNTMDDDGRPWSETHRRPRARRPQQRQGEETGRHDDEFLNDYNSGQHARDARNMGDEWYHDYDTAHSSNPTSGVASSVLARSQPSVRPSDALHGRTPSTGRHSSTSLPVTNDNPQHQHMSSPPRSVLRNQLIGLDLALAEASLDLAVGSAPYLVPSTMITNSNGRFDNTSGPRGQILDHPAVTGELQRRSEALAHAASATDNNGHTNENDIPPVVASFTSPPRQTVPLSNILRYPPDPDRVSKYYVASSTGNDYDTKRSIDQHLLHHDQQTTPMLDSSISSRFGHDRSTRGIPSHDLHDGMVSAPSTIVRNTNDDHRHEAGSGRATRNSLDDYDDDELAAAMQRRQRQHQRHDDDDDSDNSDRLFVTPSNSRGSRGRGRRSRRNHGEDDENDEEGKLRLEQERQQQQQDRDDKQRQLDRDVAAALAASAAAAAAEVANNKKGDPSHGTHVHELSLPPLPAKVDDSKTSRTIDNGGDTSSKLQSSTVPSTTSSKKESRSRSGSVSSNNGGSIMVPTSLSSSSSFPVPPASLLSSTSPFIRSLLATTAPLSNIVDKDNKSGAPSVTKSDGKRTTGGNSNDTNNALVVKWRTAHANAVAKATELTKMNESLYRQIRELKIHCGIRLVYSFINRYRRLMLTNAFKALAVCYFRTFIYVL
jgi:hypothetical protein